MEKSELSRRKLLAGIATAGVGGGAIGTGTTALFSDTETFTNNSITASKSISGVVDMEVDISMNENESEDAIVYDISLPTDKDGKDINNNPSHIWFRSVDCPTGQANPEVTLKISCKDCTEVIATGNLRDVLTKKEIREGRLLGCDSDTCLEPGESCTLKIILNETPQSDTTTTFGLKFYGEQCRYNTAPDTDNPFSETGPESCCVNCESGETQLVKYEDWDSDDEKFVVEGEDPNIEVTDVTTDGDGEPIKACFTTNYCEGVDAIVKAGTTCKTFENLGGDNDEFCVNNSHEDFGGKAISHVSFYCKAGDDSSC